MFKVVREYVDSPMYLMMCDNRACAATATGPANLANADDTRLSQSSFLKAAAKDGWGVGLDAQLCPGHAALALQQAADAKERGRQEAPLVGVGNAVESVEAAFGRPALVRSH